MGASYFPDNSQDQSEVTCPTSLRPSGQAATRTGHSEGLQLPCGMRWQCLLLPRQPPSAHCLGAAGLQQSSKGPRLEQTRWQQLRGRPLLRTRGRDPPALPLAPPLSRAEVFGPFHPHSQALGTGAPPGARTAGGRAVLPALGTVSKNVLRGTLPGPWGHLLCKSLPQLVG